MLSTRVDAGGTLALFSGSISSKTGVEESLVTFVRKAVDFRRIIVYVINVGHSHFSNDCHVIAEGRIANSEVG